MMAPLKQEQSQGGGQVGADSLPFIAFTLPSMILSTGIKFVASDFQKQDPDKLFMGST